MDARFVTMAALTVGVLLCGLGSPRATATSDADKSQPAASIETVSWLAGHWLGEGLGGRCEVIWSPPAAGTMIGMFRFMKDQQTVFYELLLLREEGGELSIKLKHFHPDLTGWEEKGQSVSFPYLRCSRDELVLDGLIHRRVAGDRLEVSVVLERRDGSVAEQTVHYRRAARSPGNTPAAPDPASGISAAAWIEGGWAGDFMGGRAEEFWSGPAPDAMMGMFRLVTDHGIGFYELMTITAEPGGLVMRLRHFNPDLSGWEERDETVVFPYLRSGADELAFDGLVFRREDLDRMQVAVRLTQEAGRPQEVSIPYQRIAGVQ